MKRQLIIATFALGAIVFGTNNVQAQTGKSVSTSISADLILADVISIDQGSTTSNNVQFKYESAKDYNTAQNVKVDNSLIVTSSKNFNVNVKPGGTAFVNGTNKIPVTVMKIKAVSGGTMAGTFNEITLQYADQLLVTNATLGAEKSLSIDYSIPAENAKTILLGKAPGTYSQYVTYTATAL